MEKKSFLKKLTGSREALLAVILILLFAVITVISPSFLTFKSITDMLKNNAVTMVMALGMLCVMLVGGIDISIMSTLALSGMSIGMLLKYGYIENTFLAFVIAMGIGCICGLVVGLVISRADVPPIIATMGFMYVFRAMGYLVSNGGEWASAAALGSFKNFATTKILGMSCVIWVIILCYVLFFIFMKWMRLGRRIYAVGSNPVAAQAPGLHHHGCAGWSWRSPSGFHLCIGHAGYAAGRRDGCHCSLRDRRRKHEWWPRNRTRSSSWSFGPGNDRESTSTDPVLRSALAEYHQGHHHSGGSDRQRGPAACN